MEAFLNFKTKKEKDDIIKWLTLKQISCDEITIENLVNIISSCKNNLNEEIRYCSELTDFKNNDTLYKNIIYAKNQKISNLIDMYNDSNTYNKIMFKDNVIKFSKTTFIKKIKLDIENFNYDIPIQYKIVFYTYDGEIIEHNIIPYNYNGLFNEYLPKNIDKTTFKVANKDSIFVYNCIYNYKGFTLGKELKLKRKLQYDFDNGYLIFDRNKIDDEEIFVKYQPNEDAFEFDINKKIVKIELKVMNDKLDSDKKYQKKLVMF